MAPMWVSSIAVPLFLNQGFHSFINDLHPAVIKIAFRNRKCDHKIEGCFPNLEVSVPRDCTINYLNGKKYLFYQISKLRQKPLVRTQSTGL